MEDAVPMLARERYMNTLKQYEARLKNEPTLCLSALCHELHTNYQGMREWCKQNGIRVCDLKSKSRKAARVESSPTFIQFMPAKMTSMQCSIKGVSITFPDGVNLTLQESTVESVISLLDIYQCRRGGAGSCSD